MEVRKEARGEGDAKCGQDRQDYADDNQAHGLVDIVSRRRNFLTQGKREGGPFMTTS